MMLKALLNLSLSKQVRVTSAEIQYVFFKHFVIVEL